MLHTGKGGILVKIYHVSDVVWKGLTQAARAHSYASTVKAVALMVTTLESTTDRASEEIAR